MSNSNEGEYVAANGIKMYYQSIGNGPPLILIHGGTGTGQLQWSKYIPEFAKHFQVFVPDTRGHGKNSNPSRKLSYPLLGDDYAAFIQALNLEKPSICGWSDGGQIALELGMKNIELGAMIVGGAYHNSDLKNDEGMHSWGWEGPGKVNFKRMKEAIPEVVDVWKKIHENWQDLIVDISHLFFEVFEYVQDDLAKISVPTLVLLGDRDEIINIETAVAMYHMIPKGELAIIPDATHSFIRKKEEPFSSIALDFLSRHTS